MGPAFSKLIPKKNKEVLVSEKGMPQFTIEDMEFDATVISSEKQDSNSDSKPDLSAPIAPVLDPQPDSKVEEPVAQVEEPVSKVEEPVVKVEEIILQTEIQIDDKLETGQVVEEQVVEEPIIAEEHVEDKKERKDKKEKRKKLRKNSL